MTEAHAATEVVMPLDTLRVLTDQLYTVLMTLVEGESFDILVGSGSGEGLEDWRRLHKRWDPLTTGRARGHVSETERRSRPLRGSKRMGEVSKAREDSDDPMDVGGFGQRKGRPTSKGRGKNPTRKGERSRKGRCEVFRTIKHAKDSRSVLELGENRSPIEGLLGKATAATEPRTVKFFWKGKRREKQVGRALLLLHLLQRLVQLVILSPQLSQLGKHIVFLLFVLSTDLLLDEESLLFARPTPKTKNCVLFHVGMIGTCITVTLDVTRAFHCCSLVFVNLNNVKFVPFANPFQESSCELCSSLFGHWITHHRRRVNPAWFVSVVCPYALPCSLCACMSLFSFISLPLFSVSLCCFVPFLFALSLMRRLQALSPLSQIKTFRPHNIGAHFLLFLCSSASVPV